MSFHSSIFRVGWLMGCSIVCYAAKTPSRKRSSREGK
ncbi:hypothetical protein-signal peptide prediction [Rhodopirellula baltica SH 1]|uniref:Uncharacterized protein n=1 Tax=Rhodopirellula baltica (strain DSM 10527 / NCIMB 13988 / SH1) TaxID=243090 RepID=Q7ULD8_RHOBA|nr:hypothetical protein-signal peptide prediction [Rhodopirellula baltica SH 1]